jgi:hypothetical protein
MNPRDSDKSPYATTQSLDRDESPSPGPSSKQRTLKEKLGLYNIFVLTLGTLAVSLAVAFLGFVWTVAINNTQSGYLPPLWHLIVRAKWVSRVVTLSSILIRVATAAQLCVFAAIVAALILERVGASTEDLPLLSMIRCANTGPNALIWNVVHTMGTGTQLGYSILIVVTILNALAMQFTSTILLADLATCSIVLDRDASQDIYFGLKDVGSGNINPYAGSDYWYVHVSRDLFDCQLTASRKTGPQTYPRFAEYKGEPATHGPNFTDTGKVYRGFLPFYDAQERKVLRNYTGPMNVVDTRVVCVKPVLSNITLYTVEDDRGSITGTIDVTDAHPDISTATVEEGQSSVENTFNCTLPNMDLNQYATTWNASLCVLGAYYARLLGGISPEADADPALPTGSTTAFLLLNATKVNDLYSNLVSSNATTLEQQESSAASWAKFGNSEMSFDLSICFVNPVPGYYEVSAWTPDDALQDVSTHIASGKENGTFTTDTFLVQDMLGADGSERTPEERGLLTLKSATNWTAMSMKNRYNVSALAFSMDNLAKVDTDDYMGDTYQFVPWSVPQDAMHRSHTALLQQSLEKTGSPALALQALLTVLMQLSYYDVFPLYDVYYPATVGLAEDVLIPRRWNSFAGVIGILGLHFVLVSIAVILFITRTEMSLLGNAWQAVSQVMSTDTADAVHHGAMATDDEVKDTVKNSGIAGGRILIAKSELSGRTEATSVVRRR